MPKFHRLFFYFFLLVAISCEHAAPSTDKAVAANVANKLNGALIFDKNCKICHGVDGRLGLNGAKDLSASTLPLNERINIITNGKKLMTPFGALLSAEEIDSVAAFTFQLRSDSIK